MKLRAIMIMSIFGATVICCLSCKGKACDDIIACSELGDIEGVSQCVKMGQSVDAEDKDGKTPMLVAVDNGNVALARSLIAHHADVNRRSTVVNWTPLSKAAYKNDTVMVKTLLDAGAKVSAPDAFGNLPIHFAARHLNAEAIKLFLDRGAAVDSKDGAGRTALWLAATSGPGDTAAIVTLLLAGANPKEKIGERRAVDWAYERDDYATVKLLMKHGSPPPKLLATSASDRNMKSDGK